MRLKLTRRPQILQVLDGAQSQKAPAQCQPCAHCRTAQRHVGRKLAASHPPPGTMRWMSTPDTPCRLLIWGGTSSMPNYIQLPLFGGTTTINQSGFINPGLTLSATLQVSGISYLYAIVAMLSSWCRISSTKCWKGMAEWSIASNRVCCVLQIGQMVQLWLLSAVIPARKIPTG